MDVTTKTTSIITEVNVPTVFGKVDANVHAFMDNLLSLMAVYIL